MSVLFWVICIVGGCIALTLTYVSWRKYNAEVRKKTKRIIQLTKYKCLTIIDLNKRINY
ncbi:sporulation protein YpjB [Virgibacillus sp. 179-BFC.A HS]|uniref:Sporulation protein YpjB n=1 Tax=Tigheibacillus jepli TaxID=3035914 RepID=A0ABU5CJL3_9BACI|nr:sporulation protein YpjB [Virgibacillus sp. 179-BFC.A HS]MDY0405713.1 sporulation protein YpjB [Virgibacillus sp. 179-BFC.A HS]